MDLRNNTINYFVSKNKEDNLELYRVIHNSKAKKQWFNVKHNNSNKKQILSNDNYVVEKLVPSNMPVTQWNSYLSYYDNINNVSVVMRKVYHYTNGMKQECYWIHNAAYIRKITDDLRNITYTATVVDANSLLDDSTQQKSNVVKPVVKKVYSENDYSFLTTFYSPQVMKEIININNNSNSLSERDKNNFIELVNVIRDSKNRLDYLRMNSDKDVLDEAESSFNELTNSSKTVFEELSDKVNHNIADPILRSTIYIKDKYNV